MMESLPSQKFDEQLYGSCFEEDIVVMRAIEITDSNPLETDRYAQNTVIQAKDVFSLLDQFEASEYLAESEILQSAETNLHEKVEKFDSQYFCEPLRISTWSPGILRSPFHISSAEIQHSAVTTCDVTPPPIKEHDYCKQSFNDELKKKNELDIGLPMDVDVKEECQEINVHPTVSLKNLEDFNGLNPFSLEHPRIISEANNFSTIPNIEEEWQKSLQDFDKKSPKQSLAYFARNKPNRFEKEKQYIERRIVYVGKILNDTTASSLKDWFSDFGPIEEINVHFRNNGDNYAFVTFFHQEDAFDAVENGKRDPKLKTFDISFGGRRHFCKTNYADLDGANDRHSGGSATNVDFDTLLKKAKADLKNRSSR